MKKELAHNECPAKCSDKGPYFYCLFNDGAEVDAEEDTTDDKEKQKEWNTWCEIQGAKKDKDWKVCCRCDELKI